MLMPIIRLELIKREDEPELAHPALQALADALGDQMGTSVAETWVSVTYLPGSGYAENRAALAGTVSGTISGTTAATMAPVFAHVLRYQLPEQAQLRSDARAMADIIADHLGRPSENIHIIFEPSARGRIAFGGELVD
jgi:phenylpyruvate tautomerase PptA (4-oxalocrotonate tautomerase family)